MDKFRTMSAMLPAIVIVAIIAGVLIGMLCLLIAPRLERVAKV